MKTLLEMRGIFKDFSGVKALNGVSFEIEENTIHALCGENGAGKSTLMKVLSGAYPAGSFTGDIILEGETCNFKNLSDSEEKGIVIIAQELALVPEMSVAENIFLGREITENGLINFEKTRKEARIYLERLGVNIPVDAKVKDLGVGLQQLIEIAKALSKNARLLILDEPTAALSEKESEKLLQILLDLKQKGITSVIISHKLKEILAIADQITVIRDGSTVGSLTKAEATEAKLVSLMVGRELTELFQKSSIEAGDVLLEVNDLCSFMPGQQEKAVIQNASFFVKRGEIVGIAGLMGAGRTELIQAIYGVWKGKITGEVKLNGKIVSIKNPLDAIRNGIALVSEDRKKYGLVLDQTIFKNITLSFLSQLSKWGFIDNKREKSIASLYKEKLGIKASSILQTVKNLSGGNQQKVVLAKWLLTDPVLLIVDEPTRGIDIGAKAEIYGLLQQLVKDGKGVLMISSELPELLGVCDRIYVIDKGKIKNCLSRAEATQEKIMSLATGVA